MAGRGFCSYDGGGGGGEGAITEATYLRGVKEIVTLVIKQSSFLQEIHLDPIVETSHNLLSLLGSSLSKKHVLKP